jgi:hypothetical protein
MDGNRDGVVGFNESTIPSKKITIGTITEIYRSDVRAFAIDNRNQPWIDHKRLCEYCLT